MSKIRRKITVIPRPERKHAATNAAPRQLRQNQLQMAPYAATTRFHDMQYVQFIIHNI